MCVFKKFFSDYASRDAACCVSEYAMRELFAGRCTQRPYIAHGSELIAHHSLLEAGRLLKMALMRFMSNLLVRS